MKTSKIILGLLILITLSALSAFAQQQFVHTVTAQNKSCNATCSVLDIPELNNNPIAIIFVTPIISNGMNLNPHPIGAYYMYLKKWSIFNLDGVSINEGSKFKVEYYTHPDTDRFVYTVPRQVHATDIAYIDFEGLNDNPNAKVRLFPTSSPLHGALYNRDAVEALYDATAHKWYVANLNSKPVPWESVYNVVLASGGSNNTTGQNPTTPANNTALQGPVRVVPSTPNGPPLQPIQQGSVPTNPPLQPITDVIQQGTPDLTPKLYGFVDMHTHLMSHLAFGAKIMSGAPDIGSLIPAGTRNCNPAAYRAHDMLDALGNCSSAHGGWGLTNTCGDTARATIITQLLDGNFTWNLPNNLFEHRHEGMEVNPNFLYWPNQTSIAHQQMWWEWIKRAHTEGKLNVMVTLAVNNELLAKVVNGNLPIDDKNSADLQIDEIKLFVGRHPDFMEIAYTSADLRRIVTAGKLAVVVGIEVDNIGDLNKPGVPLNEATVKFEIDRLYVKGVRYIFPIHLVDNRFGGTSVYSNLFNFANKDSTGGLYQVESGAVDYRLGVVRGGAASMGADYAGILHVNATIGALAGIPYPPAFNGDPTSPDFCPVPILGCWKTLRTLHTLFAPDPGYLIYSGVPGGHVNKFGLTALGKVAVKEMMKLGMLIDIDHMSDKSQNDTLMIAEQFNYPVNMGHNGLRGRAGTVSSERDASIANVKRVAALGGLFGVGTADATAPDFITSFNNVWSTMALGGHPRVAMGSDVNGLERLPQTSPGLTTAGFYHNDPNDPDYFPQEKMGNRTWDYTTEGVAHYGLIADFMRDIRNRNPTAYNNMMSSAEAFALMWEQVDRQKATVK